MEDNKIQEKLDSIREHKAKNEIVIMTEEGIMTASIEKIIDQPIEGLLYDLNRDYATLSTIAKSSKNLRWVNDMALVNVLEYVLKENKKLKEEYNTIKQELNDTKFELGELAKDPFKDMKYNYPPKPIYTIKEHVDKKSNANAAKIVPGFNDNLNIAF